MVVVVFRKDNDRLASVCMQKYKTVNAAKEYIEQDAQHLCKLFGGLDWGWIKPKTLDYYCIEFKTGVKCYWQYFQI